ncbi:hypothetical protein CKO08_00805 [Halorhodospira halochloris]|nr:hypothetical protein [Halorhodospira halochloris]
MATSLSALLISTPVIAQTETAAAPPQTTEPPPSQEAAGGLQQRTILTPRGSLIVDPSISYTQSSTRHVSIDGFTILPAVAVGVISVRESQRETITAATAVRYGLTDRLEVEARIPYVYREEQIRERELLKGTDHSGTVSSSGSGLGDIEASLRYQINTSASSSTIFTGGLRIKSRTGTDPFDVKTERRKIGEDEGDDITIFTEQPTGSGFWSVQPTLNWVHPSEPAVLYGSFSYLHNIEREVKTHNGESLKINPGDSLSLSFGVGIALNDRTSLSLGYDHSMVMRTKTRGRDRDQAEFDRFQVGSLMIGTSHRIGPRTNLGLSVGVGVTEDAPDARVSLRLPISF